MRKRTLAWALTALAWLGLCAPAGAHITVWAHGGWSWFGDPRAVYVQGQQDATFVGWIGWNGDVTIGEYDPDFGPLTSRVVGHEYHDDHSVPSILVEPNDTLTVFWSGHNGKRMDYRTTLQPENITSWGPVNYVQATIKGINGFTYPNPMILSGEQDTTYLFWRGANYSQVYETRTAAGAWSPAHELIVQPGQRPYVKYDTNGTNTIAIAFTQANPANAVTNIYYAQYRDGWLRHASGRPIKRMGAGAINPNQADIVYDAKKSHARAWVWDVALGTTGHPVIVYATFPTNANHAYWYAEWSGRRWVSHFLTYAGGSISPGTIEAQYSGGIALDHSDPSIVFLSRKVKGGWDLERWVTSDGGARWTHTVVVPADGLQNVRPVVPRGGGPIQVLWLRGDYRTYTTYRTSIAFLSGP